jgi:hypothetical protein
MKARTLSALTLSALVATMVTNSTLITAVGPANSAEAQTKVSQSNIDNVLPWGFIEEYNALLLRVSHWQLPPSGTATVETSPNITLYLDKNGATIGIAESAVHNSILDYLNRQKLNPMDPKMKRVGFLYYSAKAGRQVEERLFFGFKPGYNGVRH